MFASCFELKNVKEILLTISHEYNLERSIISIRKKSCCYDIFQFI